MARMQTPTPERNRVRHASSRSHQDVQAFLDSFAHALTRGDSHAIAALWETPAFVLADTEAHDVRAVDEVEQFFNGAKRQYNEQGIVDTRPEILTLEWPTECIALVRVRWPYLDASGRELGSEVSTYALRRNREGQLRLRFALMHGVEEVHTSH